MAFTKLSIGSHYRASQGPSPIHLAGTCQNLSWHGPIVRILFVPGSVRYTYTCIIIIAYINHRQFQTETDRKTVKLAARGPHMVRHDHFCMPGKFIGILVKKAVMKIIKFFTLYQVSKKFRGGKTTGRFQVVKKNGFDLDRGFQGHFKPR